MAATRPRRSVLAATWLAAVVGLGLLLAVSRGTRTGGDDPDPARQRPGILDLGELPVPAPRLAPGVPAQGMPTVVFFAAPRHLAALCAALHRPPARLGEAQLVVVTPPGRGPCAPGVTVLDVDLAAAARSFGLPAPRHGRLPTGYAVVDATGRTRYRTLDPRLDELLDEVATMLRAL